MSLIEKYKKLVFEGYEISKEEIMDLSQCDVDELSKAANEIRKHFCGDNFNLCTIINGKSGRCSENCTYCAQSIHYKTQVEEYDILETGQVLESAKSNESQGVHRFSIVTSGRTLTMDQTEQLSNIYNNLRKDCKINLCASHGLLNYKQLKMLKEAGVTRYHNNLETSRNYFPHICTTHSYDDKIATIKAAKEAGLEVCSGGIIGLGESLEDRIDMAFELKKLNITSVPMNILNAIKGTPLENQALLSYDEIITTYALYRFILPSAEIRMAGGRGLLEDKGTRAFKSGINAAISGDLLTTSGIKTSDDIILLKNIGFQLK